ncbi:hypothetical protein N7489_011650 [Penicillium chrysogenum]|uniref:uncharacterized protein n=1 Tax=Penicillium chrysogenum TaxID=5076 RepID=UPI0024DF28A5|nr:uncharacterized protein N7489_011650 [Penicillium chrysogenum]KAJ5230942.1 hypothetical protein N7489_011650 [Penicillium chrysogenum]
MSSGSRSRFKIEPVNRIWSRELKRTVHGPQEEYLRILARLDIRAVRAERAQSKLEQELSASKAAEKQATKELEHVSRLADIFFELSQKLGGVVDHWLKERGANQSGQEPESTKVMLDVLLKQLEAQELGNSGENSGGDSESGSEKASEQCS